MPMPLLAEPVTVPVAAFNAANSCGRAVPDVVACPLIAAGRSHQSRQLQGLQGAQADRATTSTVRPRRGGQVALWVCYMIVVSVDLFARVEYRKVRRSLRSSHWY